MFQTLNNMSIATAKINHLKIILNALAELKSAF